MAGSARLPLARSGVALALLIVALGGCHRGAVSADAAPETQYAAAMRLFRAGQFRRAQEAFTRLNLDLPARDTLVPRVRFYLAESYAGLGDYVTATREFRRVADDYPADALAPYGLLRAADTYARMWRRSELDPSNGQTAMAVYQELLGRYPNSAATQLAGVRLRELQEKFARKDYENGLFYFRRRAFDSAILYFRGLIASYPSASVVPLAFIRLVESYRAIGYREEQDETCQHLRQYFGSRRDVREACGDGSAGR